VLAGSNSVFVDMTAPGAGSRFYRVVVLGGTNDHPLPPEGFVWIPPGTFTMGSPPEEYLRFADEGPQTVVTITKGFFMSKFELTQWKYTDVMGENPSYFLGDSNRPVEFVRWHDATNYCGRLTARERSANRLIPGYRYRLPTEAEWEYTCRAGTATRYSFGDDIQNRQMGQYGWTSANGSNTTHAVGLKAPNPWGVYDMYGNAREWCSDWKGSYPGGAVVNPQGATVGTYRVVRGGGYGDSAGNDCRSASRNGFVPTDFSMMHGFRVVLAPD